MSDASFYVLKVVVSVCAALVTIYVIPYLNTLRKNEQYQALVGVVDVAVAAAEQTIRGEGQGSVKKEVVMKYITNWLNAQNITISYEQMDAIVESAVYAMNAAKAEG